MVQGDRYKFDPRLPAGWAVCVTENGKSYFKTKEGKFLKNSRKALTELYLKSGASKKAIRFIRDGLVQEGWKNHSDLPHSWMFKLYIHKIEGIDTDVLYLLSPGGIIFRSKKRLEKCKDDLGLTDAEYQELMKFKSLNLIEQRKLVTPDESWVYDPDFVPPGWRYKKYTFNSRGGKVEEVLHFLSPNQLILRGKKQIYLYLVETGTYSAEEFQKFIFNKSESIYSLGNRHSGEVDFEKSERLNKCKETFILKSHGKNKVGSVQVGTTWGKWRSDYIPSLPGWMFSIGHRNCNKVVRYKSPCGKVFLSRGSLIRFLINNKMRTTEQLLSLKKLLKTNQAKHFREVLRNDKYIKNLEADFNYLMFLKIRYENCDELEVPEENLPEDWKVKVINGVKYYKDPSGEHIFNSRKLVVEHLRGNRLEINEEKLKLILDDSEPDSDLSESEEESEEEDEGH